MKSITIVIVIMLFACLIADELVEYDFEYPQIETRGKYNELFYDDCVNIAEEGDPALPQYCASVLLPPEVLCCGIEIEKVSYYEKTENIKLLPAGRLIREPDEEEYIFWESEAYNNRKTYPSNPFGDYHTGYLCGHPLVSFLLCPIEYTPSENEVRFIKSIKLKFLTEIDDESVNAAKFLQHDHKISDRLACLADNPSALSYYGETSIGRPDAEEILLITNGELEPFFADYINYKQQSGYYVTTVLVEDIYADYPGECQQEQIRNAIIDQYQNNGIDYVILGGDASPENPAEDIIPRRNFYIPMIGLTPPDYYLASDMYYACLDGNWNDDGDNRWGEAGEEDLYAEIALGRISVDSFEEIYNHTNKMMMYDLEPVNSSVESFLMVEDYIPAGAEYMEELIYGSSNWDFETAGFSENIEPIRLYESEYNWQSSDVFNCINNGINMLFCIGSGRSYVIYKTYIHNITSEVITNDGINAGYFVGYATPGLCGDFSDRTNPFGVPHYLEGDCVCEKLLTMPTGACCYIGYSGVSWHNNTSTWAPIQFFQRQFGDAIFGDAIYEIGLANNNSQEENVALILEYVHVRNCCYSINLLGDPTLDIRTAVPQIMDVSIPDSISINAQEVSVQTGITDARIAVIQNGQLIGASVADDNGDAIVNLDSEMNSPLPLEIYVSAHNYLRWEGEIDVISEDPYVTYENHSLTEIEGNNNGQPDFGETIAVNLQMNNLGSQPVSNLTVQAALEDSFVSLIDDSEFIEQIEGNTVINLPQALSFVISDQVPNQHQFTIFLCIDHEDYDEWLSDFTVTVNAPDLQYVSSELDDSITGDGNGHLDQGETAEINLIIENSGNCISDDAVLNFCCENELITIEPEEITLGEIEAGFLAEAVISVSVDESYDIRDHSVIDFECINGSYFFSDSLRIWVGRKVEDFESGDFSSYNWEQGYQAGWHISEDAYEGSFCACADSVIYADNMILSMEINVIRDGNISFYKKTRLGVPIRKLLFKIDGLWMGSWKETEDWSLESFPIRHGHHIIEWDFNMLNVVGNDTCMVWIDQIIFPETGELQQPMLEYEPRMIALECVQGDSTCIDLLLRNEGGGTIIYDIHTEESGDQTGNRCELNILNTHFTPGQSTTWYFTAYNPNVYDIEGINIQFPQGVSVTNAENFFINGERSLDWTPEIGNGITSNWERNNQWGFGVFHDGDYAHASVDVSISESITDDIILDYEFYEYGYSGPYNEYGSLNLTCSPFWITLSDYNGALDPGESYVHNVMLNTQYLEPGSYECCIFVTSGDIENDAIIPVALNVLANDAADNKIPLITGLDNCFPNPFNPETKISYQLAEDSCVRLDIYNVKGQKVKSVINEEQKAGTYQVIWEGTNSAGYKVSSGIYFYRMKTDDKTFTKRMLLLK